MTIQTEVRQTSAFIGTGISTAFPFAFKVFAATDIVCVKADGNGVEGTLLPSEFTVSLNQNQELYPGGSVTLNTPLGAGEKLVITSDVPYLQPMGITNGGGFYPDVLNAALDRLTVLAQQLKVRVGRALQLPVTSSADPATLGAGVLRCAQSADNIDTVSSNMTGVLSVANNMSKVNTVADNAAGISAFLDIYQGVRATDPTTRLDGSALHQGDLYFNTVRQKMQVFTDSGWNSSSFDASLATTWNFEIGVTPGTADGQTVFTGIDLTGSDAVWVFYNGAMLFPGKDYTYTTNSVTLQATCVLGDVLVITNYRFPSTLIDGGTY